MTDIYHSEKDQIESAISPAEKQGMDARIAEADPAKSGDAAITQQTNDQAELHAQIGDQQYTDAIEADGKIANMETDQSQQPQAEISGFEQSGITTNDNVQTYIQDNLPPEHISGDRINEIRYPNYHNRDDTGTTLGECSTDIETKVSEIEIYNQSPDGSYDRAGLENTITHEVGHNAYYNMSPEQQNAWDSMSDASGPSEYVTPYAQTNEREDFAESYASYVRDPEMLMDTSSEKYDFMKNQVFNGREYVS